MYALTVLYKYKELWHFNDICHKSVIGGEGDMDKSS